MSGTWCGGPRPRRRPSPMSAQLSRQLPLFDPSTLRIRCSRTMVWQPATASALPSAHSPAASASCLRPLRRRPDRGQTAVIGAAQRTVVKLWSNCGQNLVKRRSDRGQTAVIGAAPIAGVAPALEAVTRRSKTVFDRRDSSQTSDLRVVKSVAKPPQTWSSGATGRRRAGWLPSQLVNSGETVVKLRSNQWSNLVSRSCRRRW